MQIAEEPLVTRREILRSLKLGAPTTEAPFSTLRARGMASSGWSVVIRGESGRVDGRLHAYSVLNVDAARALRLRQPELAQRLAARAEALEGSDAAGVLRAAISHASGRLAAHLEGNVCDDAWDDRLRRYLDARQGADWNGLDRQRLAREWLVRSDAWMHCWPDRHDELVAAVREVSSATQEARATEFADAPLHINSFAGYVRHLDPDVAEIVSPADEAWVVSRRELDREGLARLGEAVTVIREELPGGGEAWLAAPAVDLRERSVQRRLRAERDFGPVSEVTPFIEPMPWVLDSDHERWLARALQRDPFVVPRTPLRIA